MGTGLLPGEISPESLFLETPEVVSLETVFEQVQMRMRERGKYVILLKIIMESTSLIIFDEIWQRDTTFYPRNYLEHLEFNVWNRNAKTVQLDKIIRNINWRNYISAINYLIQAFL